MYKNGVWGVAPMQVVSRWCRCICALTAICAVASCNGFVWLSLCVLAYRLCATDCKRPCLVRAAAPHTAPARMPGVYAQGLCKDAKPAKHTQPFTGERGLGLGIGNLSFLYNEQTFYISSINQIKIPCRLT